MPWWEQGRENRREAHSGPDKFIYHMEEFYLAYRCYTFFFREAHLETVGAKLQSLQSQFSGGGAPVLNADAYLQVEGRHPLDYPYDVFDFGETGRISSDLAGVRCAVVRVAPTLYHAQLFVRTPERLRERYNKCAKRGPYRRIERRDYRRHFRTNKYVRGALKRDIPVRFNSLMDFELEFTEQAQSFVTRLCKEIGHKPEPTVTNIYHALSIGNPHAFWKSNFLNDDDLWNFSHEKTPYSIYVSRNTRKVRGIVRAPPLGAAYDPPFASLTIPVAFSSVRSHLEQQSDELSIIESSVADGSHLRARIGRISGELTRLHFAGAHLSEFAALPLLAGQYPDSALTGYHSGATQFIEWLKPTIETTLAIVAERNKQLMELLGRVENHLQTRATMRLNRLLLSVSVGAAAWTAIGALIALFPQEARRAIKWAIQAAFSVLQ